MGDFLPLKICLIKTIVSVSIKAEKDCVAKGGYLFHISNQQEQDFILQFINSKSFAHACWMGLNDLIMEESFDWISGKFVEDKFYLVF